MRNSFDDLNYSFDMNTDDLVVVKPHISNEIIINLDGDIEETNIYRQAFKAIYNATSNDIVHLVLNTDGGYLDTAKEFFNMLVRCPATTVAEINKAYSAGSLIALSCDEIIVNRFASMMIHTVSYGVYGKSSEIEVNAKHINGLTRDLISEIYHGFLSEEEIKTVLEGKDIWLGEKDIEKRLKKWVPIRERML